MQESDKRKILWRSRRGMLELDLLLVPFARQAFDRLAPREQALYLELLQEEDQDLWQWLIRRAAPSRADFTGLIEQILAHAKGGD